MRSPKTSWRHEEHHPRVSPSAMIHETAILIGDVRVEDNVIIHPGVIIRADEGSPIIIGEGSNIQDGVIMHGLKNSTIHIGKRSCIAHGALVHGPCIIGDNSFVGFRAVVFNTNLGRGCFVSHCSQVYGVQVDDGKFVGSGLIIDTPGKSHDLPTVTPEQRKFIQDVLEVNDELLEGYNNLEEHDYRWLAKKLL